MGCCDLVGFFSAQVRRVDVEGFLFLGESTDGVSVSTQHVLEVLGKFSLVNYQGLKRGRISFGFSVYG